MDVRMPDGTIIRNVPDGMTRSQLHARLSKAPTKMDTFARAFTQGGVAGFLDEAGAVADTLGLTPGRPNVWNGGGFKDSYIKNRDMNRAILDKDKATNPKTAMGGEIAGALMSMVAAPGGAAKGVKAMIPDAAYGAAYGVGDSRKTTASGVAKDAGMGAALGVGGGLVGRGAGHLVSRAARGKVVPKAVRELADAGVVMTPGQRGGTGKKTVERVIDTIPLIGAPGRAAKRRGLEQFNKAWIDDALEPIGVKLDPKARLGENAPAVMQWTQDVLGKAYDDALAPVRAQFDDAFKAGEQAIAQRAATMPPNQAQAFDYIMKNEITPLVPESGVLDGEAFQNISRTLRNRAASYAKTGDPADGFLADALGAYHDELLGLVGRASPGSVAKFEAANAANANLSRVWDAFSKTGQGEKYGLVTPAQAVSAASRRGYGTTTRNVAANETRMLRLPNAAKQVLPDTVPNSGTAERSLAAALLTGTIPVNPTYALPAIGTLPYAPGVDRALQNFALNPGPVRTFIGQNAPQVTAPLGLFGSSVAVTQGR